MTNYDIYVDMLCTIGYLPESVLKVVCDDAMRQINESVGVNV